MNSNKFLTKKELSNLTERRNGLASFDMLMRLTFHVIMVNLFINLIIQGQIIFGLFCFYINAFFWRFLGYAGIAHELFHGTVFSNREINRKLFYLFSYLTWNNPHYFSKSHYFHHRNTFHKDDFETKGSYDHGKEAFLRYLLFDYRLCMKRMGFVLFNVFGFECRINKNNKKVSKISSEDRQAITHARLMGTLNFSLLFLIFIFSGNWLVTLLVFMTPFCGTILNNKLADLQHSNLKNSSAGGDLFHSRTVILPGALSFFYANMNYHAEHHLYPAVPYYNLPKLFRLIEDRRLARTNPVKFSFSR